MPPKFESRKVLKTQIILFNSTFLLGATEWTLSKQVYIPNNATIKRMSIAGYCYQTVGTIPMEKAYTICNIADSPTPILRRAQGTEIRLSGVPVQDFLYFSEESPIVCELPIKGMKATEAFTMYAVIGFKVAAPAAGTAWAAVTITYEVNE